MINFRVLGVFPFMTRAAKPTPMLMIAKNFAPVGMARDVRQARIGLPRLGWDTSHRSKRGDDREKHAAAAIKKGVVGSRGRTMPKHPTLSRTKPAAARTGARREAIKWTVHR